MRTGSRASSARPRSLASLNHPNIAQIYGLERSDGRTALVMELVEGPTLAERIAQGAMPPNEALDVALQIAPALEAAHERGIVHRDLKPANIKLRPDGTVKVLDFGIAKALDARAISGPQPPALTTPAMTEAGVVLGTAAYMTPEQARGKPVDRRADIWAFGCVLYEMLTGKRRVRRRGRDDDARARARARARHAAAAGRLAAGRAPHARALPAKGSEEAPRDIGDVRLALEGELAQSRRSRARRSGAARCRSRRRSRSAPCSRALLVAMLVKRAQTGRAAPTAPPVTRFVITPPATAPLANLGGYDVMISPDGKRLAYFGRNPENGNVALYVRELDGLEARVVPGTEVANVANGFGGNMNPFFSADGQLDRLLVARSRPDSRAGRRRAADQDGRHAVAGLPRRRVDRRRHASSTRRAGSLHRVSAGGGGTPERLTEELSNTAFVASPVVLPGGRAVLFGVIDDGAERVAVLDLDTGEQKILIEGGQNPFYSPTGHIVFARGTTLMAAPFDAAELAVNGRARRDARGRPASGRAHGGRLRAVRDWNARLRPDDRRRYGARGGRLGGSRR